VATDRRTPTINTQRSSKPANRNINDVERVNLQWDEFLGAHAVNPKLQLLQSTSAEALARYYDVLNDASTTMTPKEIASHINKDVNVVKKHLARLVQDKLVSKSGYGLYTAVPIQQTIHSGNSIHSVHSGNSIHSSDTPEQTQSEQGYEQE
jgi:hypothetical protein